ncbi:MAG: hypothetical protein WDM92_00255 [Caulobacteraceae bacterium]
MSRWTPPRPPFEGERQGREVGLRSTIEVLNALQELIAAQAQVVRDRYNAYAAQTALLAASGLLEAKAIVPDVEMFDPDKDLRRAKQTFLMPWTPALKLVGQHPLSGAARPRAPDPVGASGRGPAPAAAADPGGQGDADPLGRPDHGRHPRASPRTPPTRARRRAPAGLTTDAAFHPPVGPSER